VSKDDLLKEAQEAFELAAECENENRIGALDDLRFARLEEQWPEQVRKQREVEGRPCLTINRLPTFIRQVVNDARQNKPSISVHPVDSSADPEVAEIFSGLIRNIEATSDADVAYDTALECAVTSGVGYFRIGIDWADDDSFDKDIRIKAVPNPFAVYGDPHSTAADSADWNSAFVVDHLSRAAFKRQFKGADPVDWDALGYTGLGEPWCEEDRVMVAEWWRREEVIRKVLKLSDDSLVDAKEFEKRKAMYAAAGVRVIAERDTRSHKVTQYLLTGAEVLETNQWAGKYIPIVPVYGESINVEGKRVLRSLIRSAKDAQRMFNYWRTASTELVALAPKAPYIGPKGSFETDAEKWATANTQTHAFIEYDPVAAGRPERQPFAGPPAGALQEAMNASDDIKSILGMFDASLGQASNETSGRAILARQREGDVSTFHFIDNLSRAIRHAGRILIDLIPPVYDHERVVRVLGKDDSKQNVPLNQPVPVMQEGQPVMTPQGVPETRIYALGQGKYDLTVTAGPSFTTQREEAANQMIELVRAFPAAAPVLGDLIAKNLDWTDADEVAKRLGGLQQGQQDPNAAAQAEMAQQAAKLQAEGQIKREQAQMDAQIEQQKLAANVQLMREKQAAEIQLMRERAEAEMMLERERAQHEAQLKALQIAANARTPQPTLDPVRPGGAIG
jgi:hypothetical protein